MRDCKELNTEALLVGSHLTDTSTSQPDMTIYKNLPCKYAVMSDNSPSKSGMASVFCWGHLVLLMCHPILYGVPWWLCATKKDSRPSCLML